MSAGAVNDNAFGGKHPVDLCEPKATKESILLQLKRLTGFLNPVSHFMSPVSRLCHISKCDIYKRWNVIELGMPSLQRQDSEV